MSCSCSGIYHLRLMLCRVVDCSVPYNLVVNFVLILFVWFLTQVKFDLSQAIIDLSHMS